MCASFCAVFLWSAAVSPALHHIAVFPLFSGICGRAAYKFGTKFDITYGIYLYGFFFQQLVVQLVIAGKIPPNYTAAFLASALPTLVAAFLSYVIVEKPS